MNSLVKFGPLHRKPMHRSFFDDAFTKSFANLFNDNGFNMPAVNIKEDENGFTLEFAAPGLKKEDFAIQVEKNVLTVSAEQKTESEEKTDNYTRKEFSFGQFKRSFHLPETVALESIEATYTDGVLTVGLPKKEEAKEKGPLSIDVA